jgi:hypothetical protein
MSEINFDGAVDVLLAGKRITRKAWDDKRTYCFIKDRILQIHKAGEKKDTTRPWILSDEDMMADDWIIL